MTSIPQAAIGVTFIALLLPALFIAAVAAIIVAVLYFRHRERMAYLTRPNAGPPGDSGAQPGPSAAPPYPPYPPHLPPPPRQHPSLYHPIARVGRLIGIGAGVTVGLLWPFGLSPLLLFGLIPLFIGLIRLGELYISPVSVLPPEPVDLNFWLQRSLWGGGIGLALLLGLLTIGLSPLLLAGTIPVGYGLGMLLAYALARRMR